MNLEKLYEQLKIDEGVKYEIYLDHLGYPTFGIGHLIKKSDEEFGREVGTPVSEERVRHCFDEDVHIAIRECHNLYGEGTFTALPDGIQQVLVNMMFNLGSPRLKKFLKFNDAIEKHNWRVAAAEGRDSLWYRQVPVRAERLMTIVENIS